MRKATITMVGRVDNLANRRTRKAHILSLGGAEYVNLGFFCSMVLSQCGVLVVASVDTPMPVLEARNWRMG